MWLFLFLGFAASCFNSVLVVGQFARTIFAMIDSKSVEPSPFARVLSSRQVKQDCSWHVSFFCSLLLSDSSL